MEAQVAHIIKAVRSRYWTLRNLKANGFNEEEFVQAYKTVIWPVTEYGCVVFHSSLTDEQDEKLERLQDHALKCIYRTELSARRLRGKAGLDTLRARREEINMKFATKCANDPVFARWFPLETSRRSTRNGHGGIYKEEKACCERLKNSPLFYFRRILNGRVGKTYGVRNKDYRENVITNELP